MNENTKSNTSMDSISLELYEEKLYNGKKCKKKHHHHKKHTKDTKRSEKKSTSHETNINISQKIQVENEDFQYVINFNTSVHEHKSRHKKKCGRKHRPRLSEVNTRKSNNGKSTEYKTGKQKSNATSHSGIIEQRITPICFRRYCWNRYGRMKEDSGQNHVTAKNHNRYHYKRNKTSLNNDTDMDRRVFKEQKNTYHHRNWESLTNVKQTESRTLLSPISSTSLDMEFSSNLTYEEVSSDSLDSAVDEKKPTAQKRRRRRKHSKHCTHWQQKRERDDSKLDTLIKRTKERERKLVEQSRSYQPRNTSTPIYKYNEYTSGDLPMTCSDMDISLDSISTLVLTRPVYSPSCPVEDLNISTEGGKLINYQPYSPSSPSCPIEDQDSLDTEKLSKYRANSPNSPTENLTPKAGTHRNELSIVKTEPAMDIDKGRYQAYSPNSPTEDYTPELEMDYKFSYLKTEPTMDIGAYSPTQPTSTPKLTYFTEVKKEIVLKTEPFPSDLSPIYCENNNNAVLGLCKTENVKTKSMFI